ncbi:MAG: hypothetical protein ACLPI9_00350, partial [Halobacteriota archaeon]
MTQCESEWFKRVVNPSLLNLKLLGPPLEQGRPCTANWSVRIRSTKVSEPVVPRANAITDEGAIRSMMAVR